MATTVTENPLNNYNSFSYHHFLILVSSTAVADTLTDSDTLFRFITGEESIKGAVVVINPLISNRFVIQEIEWTSMLASNNIDFGSTIWSSGTMNIIEPRGISFMNVLYDAVDQLGTSIDNCLWVLKTVFIGDTGVGDGHQRYQYINYVKPTVVVVTDVQIAFDEGGGRYDLQFTLADDGAGAYKQVDGAAFHTDTTVNLAGGDTSGAITIESALQTLEKHVNATYDKTYQIALKTAEAQPNAPTLERIQYKIEIPEELRKPEYVVTNSKGQGMGRDGSSASITVHPGSTLTDAITEVLKSCKPLTTEVTTNGKKKIFQVKSKVTQNEPGVDPRKVFTFSIYAKEANEIDSDEAELTAQDKALTAGNYIEYDYMYTGKNIDVLDFQMKMNTGILFFNTILTRSSMREDRSESMAAEYLNSPSNKSKFGSGGSTTVHYPSQLSAPENGDKADPTSADAYQNMLDQYTMIDNIMVNLKIRGNPRLLNGIAPSSADINNAAANGVDPNLDGGGDLMVKWATQPVFCRVNVRMPKDGEYATIENFWYRGLYRVMTVKNVFSGGEFTQELELITELNGLLAHVPESNAKTPAKVEEFSAIVGEPTEVESRIRAFMQMLRFCEGTTGDDGYRTLFGGSKFNSFADHPRQVIRTPTYDSSAAGAYQILTKTWNGLTKKHKDLSDFEPASQDMACYYLLKQRNALQHLRSNNVELAIQVCNPEWASLPGSKYGQPRKSVSTCVAKYQEYLQKEKEGQTTLKIELGRLQ